MQYRLYLQIITHTIQMEFQYTINNIPPGKAFIVQKLQYKEYSAIQAHKYYELNLISSGHGKRIVGNNISLFENGDLILIGPDLPHGREFANSDLGMYPECLTLIISETLINSGITQFRELESIQKLFGRSFKGLAFKGNRVKEVAQQMEKLAGLEGFESFIALLRLLNTLTEIEEQEILSLTPELPVSYYKDLNHIKTVYNFVMKNLQNRITLDTAAGLLNMAPGSFCRFFKKRTGKSFIQYVKDIRISHASNMLSNTELPIAQISFESGYSNLANFNFYFKSLMKMTPSEYRKNFR